MAARCAADKPPPWQGRKQRQQREHGLDAFAGGHDAGRLAEAHRVPKELAHGALRIGNGGLAAPVAGKPGALQAGERAAQVRDSAEQCWPAFERHAFICAVIAGGMKAQGADLAKHGPYRHLDNNAVGNERVTIWAGAMFRLSTMILAAPAVASPTPGFRSCSRREGRVGAVLSIEASRLARNGRGWHIRRKSGRIIWMLFSMLPS